MSARLRQSASAPDAFGEVDSVAADICVAPIPKLM